MAWIEAHQGLANHIKTIKLRKLLKIKKIEAVGILFMFWWWSLDNAPDGDISSLDDSDISEIVEYKSKSGVSVLAALIESGFVDENKHIHDWHEYAGKLIDKRKTDAERKKASYELSKAKAKTSECSPTDIHRISRGVPSDIAGNSTVQYSTVQNSTEEERKEGTDIASSDAKPPKKHKYGLYQNVLLSDDEYRKLADEFTDLTNRIEKLSEYIESKGAKYKSHIATIRAWARHDRETAQYNPTSKIIN